MILDCRNGVRGVLVDENGQRIPLACWADTDTGEFEALRTADGKTPLRGLDGKPILYRGRRPALRFIAAQSAPPPPRPASAAPLEELRKEVLKGRTVRRLLVLPGGPRVECDEPKCHREARWQTADQVEVEPEPGPNGELFSRKVITRRHVWCAWHYQAPTTTDQRGVESETEITVRPS